MTQSIANRVIIGSGVIAFAAIISVMLLAYWRLVDGATAVAVILGVLGVANGTNTTAHAKVIPAPHNSSSTEQ